MIVNHSRRLGRKLHIAVIDDEVVYRNAIRDMLSKREKISDIISLEFFNRSEELLAAFEKKSFDTLLCDIDLGHNSLDGYSIISTLRKSGCNTPICVHSNRSLPEDYSQAISLGAQALIPKPLTLNHFLKFITNTFT